jgi:phosphonate transport system permease protein
MPSTRTCLGDGLVSLLTEIHEQSALGDFIAAEGARAVPPTVRRRALSAPPVLLVTIALAVWTAWSCGIGRRRVLNPGGWTIASRFVSAALQPDLSGAFLARTARAALVTVSYGALGTALSLALGLVGGLTLSRSTWTRRLASVTEHHVGVVGGALRFVLAVPRGIHEAVWGLLFVNLLGRNPLVAVLAIGIPFGAITAKVYADLIDERAPAVSRQLRSSGSGRIAALAYGALPETTPDLISYAFYRFECSIRSAVVLGMVGAGGIGFQLSQSFQGLAYRELWTSIYALVLLGLAAEAWGVVLRSAGARVSSTRTRRWSIAAALVLVAGAWWRLHPSLSSLWAPRTRRELTRLISQALPPKLPKGGLRTLYDAAASTLQMSFLAIVIAVLLAAPVAMVGARSSSTSAVLARRVGSFGVRLFALVTRSVPATVWALIVLFVVFPGILPGAFALGIYTFGVLVRLFGEALENADSSNHRALRARGVGGVASFMYGTWPSLVPTWASYGLYRWEVAAREAAVVGVVGAGGLGRLLGEQTAAFAYPKMLVTIASLVAITVLVDRFSCAARRVLR